MSNFPEESSIIDKDEIINNNLKHKKIVIQIIITFKEHKACFFKEYK